MCIPEENEEVGQEPRLFCAGGLMPFLLQTLKRTYLTLQHSMYARSPTKSPVCWHTPLTSDNKGNQVGYMWRFAYTRTIPAACSIIGSRRCPVPGH